MNNRKTVLLIDDHPLFRTGLKDAIERDDKFEIIGETGKARTGLRMARQLQPDIVIVDLSLPDMNGILLTSKIRDAVGKTQVMVVSLHSKIDYVAKSIQAGAIGYVAKSSASDSILKCINLVSKGKQFIDDSLSDQLCELMTNLDQPANEIKPDKYGTLTDREQEVLRLVAEGHSSKEIGEQLGISHKTVATHRGNIMKKLNLKNTMSLTRYAVNIGLIDPEEWKQGLTLG